MAATPGGFCAAIAAAREGASVILLEPTDHVGAMSTGGLSHCDSNQMVRSTLMGLFHEWHTRVVKDYTDRGLKAPYNPAKKDQSRWTFEPHVAMRVTMQMLDEAGVTVLTQRYLKSVTKNGPRITSLVTKNGTFTARVFVDGTYEGDLMAAAGVDWTIGRESREEYGESLAGKQYSKQKMNINGFDDEGRLLPLITTDDAGDEEAGDKNIMTYSFRLCLTADPDNRVPMPEPDNYDPARFEIVRRALKAGEKRVGFDLYPLPGGKLDGNNSIGGQFSIGLIGGGNDWHSADEAGRKKIWEAHKQYTLEFYHFLTTDPAVPTAIRNRYAKLGLCKDEFAGYDHFSPALYVRESRRMKGLYVISQKDILKSPEKDDPIAISSFPIDSHDCQRIALKGGGVINEGTIFPVQANSRTGLRLPRALPLDPAKTRAVRQSAGAGRAVMHARGHLVAANRRRVDGDRSGRRHRRGAGGGSRRDRPGTGVCKAPAATAGPEAGSAIAGRVRSVIGKRFHRCEDATGNRARRCAREADRQLVSINEFQTVHRKRIRLQRRERFPNKRRRQSDRDLSIQGGKVRSISAAHGLLGS